MRNFAFAVIASFAVILSAGAASATTQPHYFVFKNNSTETFNRTAQSVSGAGGIWTTTQPSSDPAGGTKTGLWTTNDFAAISYSDTWTSSVDGTYCSFSIYSSLNSFGNLQFYESMSKGGPRASTIKCAITAPPQPYSTNHGNVEMDYNVGF